MAKKEKKETFFEKLARKNTQEEKITLKSKKTRIATYTILGFLGAATVIGIGVPLTINEVKINNINEFNNKSNIFKFISKDGSTKEINYGQIQNYIATTDKETQDKLLNDFSNEIIKKLYEEEYQDSLKFEYILNNSLLEGEDKFTNIALKSFDDLKKEELNKIKDQEKFYKKNYREKWESEFISYLSTNYAEAKTSEEAATYSTIKNIKKDALRRYVQADESMFSYKDWNRKARRNIFELEVKNNEVIENKDKGIAYKKDSYVFRDKLLVQVDIKNPNIEKQNFIIDSDSSLENKKTIALLNNSFSLDKSKRSFLPIIEEFAKSQNKYSVTKAQLPIQIDYKDLDRGAWKITKEGLINLFSKTISKQLNNEYEFLDENEQKDFYSHDNFNVFMRFFADNKANDSKQGKLKNGFLNIYMDAITSNGLGGFSQGINPIQSFENFATEKAAEEILTLFSNSSLNFNNQTFASWNSNDNLLYKAFSEFKKILISDLSTKDSKLNWLWKLSNFGNPQTVEQVIRYNEMIKDYFNSFSDDAIKEIFGRKIKNIFYSEDGANALLSYKYKNGDSIVNVVPTEKSLLLISYEKEIATKEEIFNKIISDAQNTFNGKSEKYKYLEAITKFNTEHKIQEQMLKNITKEEFNINKDLITLSKKYKQEIVNSLLKNQETVIDIFVKENNKKSIENQLKIFNDVDKFIKDRINSNQFVKNIQRKDGKIILVDNQKKVIAEDAVEQIRTLIEKEIKGGE
ncbi:hypothetical protein QLQ80_02535 [Mycoplasma sp. M5725]|uniref:Membrane protein P80 n=1 Tax=Mycoplasma phocimorsus TaxID=3045839 RepID=A0AAJ1PSD3_9MOLU|nr:hypothetical protein [Mycoplasma phocimorsus]MDJ1645946.1 hypothetical protein [Mycoplasma phocimorsus]